MAKTNARLKRTFDKVDGLLDKEPTSVGRSGRLLLKADDDTHVTLAGSNGKLTPAGKRWFEKTGKQYNSAFDEKLPLVRKGAREFVQFRDGTQKLARTYRDSDHMYTRAGRNYFAAKGDAGYQEFLFNVPVKIKGTARGRQYDRFGSLPSTALDMGPMKVPIAMSMPEKEEWLRGKVLEEIAKRGDSILDVSSESYSYHTEGAWSYSVLESRVAEDGSVAVEATLDRPLQQGKPLSYSSLPNAWSFDPTSFEDSDNDCVVYQLSRQLGIDEDGIREDFDRLQLDLYADRDIYEGVSWRKVGPTARMLKTWCEKNSYSCYLLWGKNMISSFVGDKTHHTVAACIWGDHLYTFKENKNVIANMQVRIPQVGGDILGKPARPSQVELPELSKWGGLMPGHFWAHKDELPTSYERW